MKTRMNVYEYTIGSGKKKMEASYTVVAGCEKEAELKKQLKSHLVQSFDHEKRAL